MAKPVCGVCNLDCTYCYYTAKPRELYPAVDKFMMSEEVLEGFTEQYLTALPQRCEFGWQGGEPLLAGKDFFRKAIAYQQQYAGESQGITNGLQTNGTLLDDEWCELLAGAGFLVGISIDGPPQWHDAFRKDHAGAGTFHRAWGGLELLRKHRVETNVLVTLNNVNAPHAGDVYRYFVNRGIKYLQFIPILERGGDGRVESFSCTAEQFGRFMLDVFEIWTERDVGKVSERFIDNTLHQLIYQAPAMCCYAPRCANAYVLEFNGDLYACDHFVFADWKIGNILDRPLVELLRDEKLDTFAALKTDLPAACRDCEFLEFCNGGCPKHHSPPGKDPARVNYFCEGYKMFFREALGELKKIAQRIKDGSAPSVGPSAGAVGTKSASGTARAAAGKPPGRNDPCPCGSGRKFKRCCGRK